MTHIQFLLSSDLVEVHSVRGASVYFTDKTSGEGIAEVGGGTFPCGSLEEFEELVEFFEDETFEVQSLKNT